MITEIFKSLADHFKLPSVVKEGAIRCADWRYHDMTWFEFDLYLEGQHDDYCYSKQFYGPEFEAHCRETNDIPRHSFYEWWNNLGWLDKQVEIETFCEKRMLGPEIEEHYQSWLKK
ncbi:hypothetical protein [Chitinophaga japonensis]|uniref:Uncharacterized protein n=1 Tax=Chitinophaga japonensis TaxID=104662 RepID=A0A562SZZ4_CHIJA|nr:hypothetical protein [Chitinophaga japonensis]TWI86330.1 hypothetical protein LX66_3584 [Chitinophaga japonensis]